MAGSSLTYFSLMFFIVLVMINYFNLANAHQDHYSSASCREERCSKDEPPIRFPFQLKDSRHQQPNNSCGYPGFELVCERGITTLYGEFLNNRRLFVRNVDYKSQEIQVYSYDCANLNKALFSELFLNQSTIIFPFKFKWNISTGKNSSYTVLNCSSSASPLCDVELAPSNSEIQEFRYRDFLRCTKMYDIDSFPDEIFEMMSTYSITLTWSKPDCRSCEAKRKECRRKIDIVNKIEREETECVPRPKKGRSKFSTLVFKISAIVGASVISILVVVAAFYLYTSYKSDKEIRRRIEKFLEDYTALKPSRYTYADIKKITNQFKDKLGEGSYGTVFKGKLSNDVFVAVKILNQSKGNGEEFVNEVSTIGQIHHVNVVRFVGYCAEGFRRALIYEFLPNDSLEKYISSVASSRNHLLSWMRLEEIALGIAKGIDYLHQGCDQRILHFDIKPHNILLDHNFKPKISDFGLAKLCSKDQSIVSMTTVRGTIGYIAPEIFAKNFGNVSYKSDVYSFGMLLLEMVGGRKSTIVTEGRTDEIYYPEWIYNLLEGGEDFRMQIEEEEDVMIAKKLAVIGLWCIQWHPTGRPTMKVVVQMLEGAEELTMPPNPFASTGPTSERNRTPARRMTGLELETIAEIE